MNGGENADWKDVNCVNEGCVMSMQTYINETINVERVLYQPILFSSHISFSFKSRFY